MSTDIYDPYPPLNNKYYRWYCNIICKLQQRNWSKNTNNSIEHHITPKSFFKIIKQDGWLEGDPNIKSNLIYITDKEHHLLHWLLCYCYKEIPKLKMIRAFNLMCKGNKSSKYYDYARKLHKRNISGKNNPFYAKKHTTETLEYLSFINTRENNPLFGKKAWNNGLTGEKSFNFGQKYSKDRVDKQRWSHALYYIIITPEGFIQKIHNLNQFCKDNNLHQAAMQRVAKGVQKFHKGWKCYYCNNDLSIQFLGV